MYKYLVAALLFCACNRPFTEKSTLVTLKKRECSAKGSSHNLVTVCFDSIINDSRCPVNVVCVWEGYAQVRLSVQINDQHHSAILSTRTIAPFATTDTTISGHHIQLLELLPLHPGMPEEPQVKIKID